MGDSISLGYREFVKEMLAGVAKVYYPPENGRFAAYTFRAFYEWSRKWPNDMNFVYWNNGLWDVVRIFGDEPQTPLTDYEIMIRRIYNRLKYLFPKAQIIFATTTPVIEELMEEKIFYRRNEDIKIYNAAAIRIITECGGIVHDLHGADNFWTRQTYQDSTHFTLSARKVQAKLICEFLNQFMMKN